MKLNIVLIIFALITSICIGFDGSRPEYYKNLWLIPFSHMLCALFLLNSYKKLQNNLAYSIITTCYFIRNVFVLFVMYYFSYNHIFTYQSIPIINHAIFLMIYETVCVYLFMLYLSKKTNSEFSNFTCALFKKNITIKLNEYRIKTFTLFIISCLFLIIVIYITIPNIKDTITNLFADNASILVGLTEDDIKDNTILYTLFSIFLKMLKLFIPTIIVLFIRKYFIWINIYLKLLLSFIIVVVLELMIMSPVALASIINIAILSVLLLKLYERQRKLILLFMGGGLVALATVFFFGKTDNSVPSTVISMMFQAYFPNIQNWAAGLMLNKDANLEYFLGDLYACIPFRDTLFGFNLQVKTIDLYKEQIGFGGQIIPCGAQYYLHLGYLFPIIPMLLVYIAFFFNSFRNSNTDIFKYVVLTSIVIYAAITPILYNLSIFLLHFLSVLFPMLLIVRYKSIKSLKSILNV